MLGENKIWSCSALGIAKKGTNSLRTTIPEGIVEFLNINAGDKIEWKMELQNGKKYVSMSKGRFVKTTNGKIVGLGRKVG